MTFEAALKEHLQGSSGITALLVERITPQPVPQSSAMPAITYVIVGDAPQTDLSGVDGELIQVRVQIDCWSKNHQECMQLAELVRVRMQTAHASFKAVPLSALEDYERATQRHRLSREFSCWFRTTS